MLKLDRVQTSCGRAAATSRLIDKDTFLCCADKARLKSDRAGQVFGLYFLYIEKSGVDEYRDIIDELSLLVVDCIDSINWMSWLDSQSAIMGFMVGNEDRLVTHAIGLHQHLEAFVQNHPSFRHYLGVSVSMGEKDNIDAMITRAARASSEGFRAESSQQTGTVRFFK